MSCWREESCETLLGLQSAAGGWPYRSMHGPCAEPTALSALALLSTQPARADGEPKGRVLAAVQDAAAWLARIQNRDGSIGVSAQVTSPGWPTPYAVWLWSALGGYSMQRKCALEWLLKQRGEAVTTARDGTIGHDASLVGWPWVPGTHSWVEPTALAVLALRAQGQGRHERVSEGLRLLADRAVDSGGWNYGNRAVYGSPLRAQPAPTGLVLAALSHTDAPREIIERAVHYLLEALPETRSAMALGWGVIGLQAWGRCPAAAEVWLAESAEQAFARPDPTPRLALLLLAQSERALGLIGLHSARTHRERNLWMTTRMASR